MIKYIKDLFSGIYALLQGMYITNLNFWRPKVTEQYPEDRQTARQFERFRGELVFDMICTQSCAQKAIKWTNNFEHAVFNRSALVKQLNPEGSKAIERKPTVAAPKAAPAAGQNENQQ